MSPLKGTYLAEKRVCWVLCWWRNQKNSNLSNSTGPQNHLPPQLCYFRALLMHFCAKVEGKQMKVARWIASSHTPNPKDMH